MDNELRYNKLNRFLKNKFGEKVLKICIDGGFTCPNRDGKKSTYGFAVKKALANILKYVSPFLN